MSEDSKTTCELFLETLEGEYEDDAPWGAVTALRRRNNSEVFRFAEEFCQSDVPLRRARGLDVLAQLGAGEPMANRPFFADCVRLAIQHVGDEAPLVVDSAAWALAHLGGDHAISKLIEIRKHAESSVRWAVAVGIAGSERPDAIRTLMELMEDPDDDVRNWATFGLGTQTDFDSSEVRQALQRRLSDTFEEARDEAVWGLARRRDRTGIMPLLEWFESGLDTHANRCAAFDALGKPYSPDTPISELCEALRQILRDLDQPLIQRAPPPNLP